MSTVWPPTFVLRANLQFGTEVDVVPSADSATTKVDHYIPECTFSAEMF